MKKLKIIHVLHAVGGVDVSVRLITQNIDSAQHETIIIHGTTDTQKPFLDNNSKELKEYALPISREISPYNDLKAIQQTIKILRKEKPDVVHAHSAKGGIIARAASMFYAVPVLHTPQAYSFLSEPKGLKRLVFLGIEKFFKNINATLLASSNSERNRGIQEVGYKEEKALVFNNSINPISNKFVRISEINLPENFICTVGRPSFQKNIELMIEVLKTVKLKQPNIHLVLMGVGEYSPNKQQVEQLITAYNLESNITMIPWIAREKIFAIIKKSKLYISTARYEGLPYSIIASLAIGKACVVTDCDGNRDLIEDGYNGYVIKENMVDTMANRIFALLEDDILRNTLGENALTHFNTHFNIEENSKKLEAIYKQISKK
jgi:glycosyltransferase involved in cell wall biosynthesis